MFIKDKKINDDIYDFNGKMISLKEGSPTKALLVGVDTENYSNYSDYQKFIFGIGEVATEEYNFLSSEIEHSALPNHYVNISLGYLYNGNKYLVDFITKDKNESEEDLLYLQSGYLKKATSLMTYIVNNKDIDQIKNMMNSLAAMLFCQTYLFNEAFKKILKDKTYSTSEDMVKQKKLLDINKLSE